MNIKKKQSRLSNIDRVSIGILLISVLTIAYVLTFHLPQGDEAIFSIIGLIGSIASTGGLIIAIIQIVSLKQTSEATKRAIFKTEKELSIMKAIESASNCFNQLNQIDEYLETMNVDSIKTLLPIATQNFHELIFFTEHNLEKIMQEKDELGKFLEHFAGQLTIIANHKNIKKEPYSFDDKSLEKISLGLQQTKAFVNIYRNNLQQAIIKE